MADLLEHGREPRRAPRDPVRLSAHAGSRLGLVAVAVLLAGQLVAAGVAIAVHAPRAAPPVADPVAAAVTVRQRGSASRALPLPPGRSAACALIVRPPRVTA